MLLPITTTSQTLKEIIDGSNNKQAIYDLLRKGYNRISLEESGDAIYKDMGVTATSITSTRVGTGGVFNAADLSDITLVSVTNTNVIIDFNKG